MSALVSAVASTFLSVAGGSVQGLHVDAAFEGLRPVPQERAVDGLQQFVQSALVDPANDVATLNDILVAAQERTQQELTEIDTETGVIDPSDEAEPVDVADAGPEMQVTLDQIASAAAAEDQSTDEASEDAEAEDLSADSTEQVATTFEQTPEWAEEDAASDEAPAESEQDAAVQIDDTLDAADSPWTYIEASAQGHWLHQIGEQLKQEVASLLD